MSKSDAFEAAILDLVFKGTAIANLADNAASSPLTNLVVHLHTADPGESGTQATNQATYGGYAAVNVARGAGWTRSITTISPTADILFPAWASGASNTITHFSVGNGTMIFYSGTVTPNISVSSGVQPKLSTNSTITED